MLHIVGISEIKRRADAVNVSLKTLARRAAVDPSTVYSAAAGKCDSRGRTLEKMTVEIEAEEIRIAQHLLTLPHVQDALRREEAA